MPKNDLPAVRYVLVGYSVSMVEELDRTLPPQSVLLVEEPDVIDARDIESRVGKHPCCAGLVPAPTQRERDPSSLVAAVGRPVGVRVVFPGVEYGVVGAAALAEAWGLPGAGLAAACAFRDKSVLRAAADRAWINQPAWQSVSTHWEVAAFRDRFGGRCVLKPTNRQASLGVQLLGPDDDLAAAWEATRLVDEPRMLARGAMPMGFLVEEHLDGPEVSVECLVDRGRPVFSNITAKLVQPGPRPVELGHTVPAPLPDAVSRRLASAMADLITVTGFGSGVLHAEWILRNGTQPHLVECAARLPGDCIDTLIDLAYGGSILADLLAVLGGGQPATPPAARGGAAIRFLTARPGVVSAVTGVDEARALPGVREVTVSTALGATVPATNSSWDRIGSVIATARTAAEAGELAARAAETIAVETEPPA